MAVRAFAERTLPPPLLGSLRPPRYQSFRPESWNPRPGPMGRAVTVVFPRRSVASRCLHRLGPSRSPEYPSLEALPVSDNHGAWLGLAGKGYGRVWVSVLLKEQSRFSPKE